MSSGKGVGQERRWVPPASFDGYRLLRPLGAGGMGLVYLGHDLLLDRPVAIKFIAGAAPDHRRRERFLFEGRALARLLHPNVVLTFRVGDVEGRPFLVSEYVSGRSLDQLERTMPWRRVLEIGIGLARGLAAAHRAGVLHRDVKPANVVLTEDGTVKLIDFGLAKLVGDDDAPAAAVSAVAAAPGSMAMTESDGDGGSGASETLSAGSSAASSAGSVSASGAPSLSSSLSASFALAPTATLVSTAAPAGGGAVATYPPASPDLSRPGTVVGTRRYMAPERLSGQPATRRSDIYSLGCLLHELCWGTLPAEPPPVSSARVAPELLAILERCLAPDPADRFASVDAVLEALEALADDTSASGDAPAGNPYRGLEAFDAAHRAVFLGRSSEVLAIVEKLRADRVVVIAGDSGVGKSSLCKAGVLPWIAESGLLPGRGAIALAVAPGRDPAAQLAGAIAGLLGEAAPDVRERLASEPAEVARQIARAAGDRTAVLFVDQIEELFTLAPDGEAAATARTLAALVRAGNQLRVLATVRGDFLARLAGLPELGPEVARAPYLLRPLGPDKLREVIVGPARRTGVSFATETVDELLRAALSSEGSLPLLSFTLAELWDARDAATGGIPPDALAGLGGVEGALERHADRVIGALSGAHREAARRLLVRLVTAQRTRAALDKGELVGSPDDEIALEALIAGRLVVVRGGERGAVVELAHEALITRWSQLRQWLDDEAEHARLRERLAAAAGDWDRLGRRGDGVWGRRQLAGAAALDAGDLGPREQAFLSASRTAARRSRLLAVAVPVAVVGLIGLAIGLSISGARARARSEIAAAVDRKLAEARAHATEARRLDVESAQLHAEALRRFDQASGLLPRGAGDDLEHSWEQAEGTWARVLSVSDAATTAYARASSAFEAALFIDPSRAEIRDELAHLLAARLALAERLHQRAVIGELAERLAGLVATGAAPALRTADQTQLTVHRTPPDAAVAIARFEPDSRGRLVLGPPAPLAAGPLAPGSYLLIGRAPGRATVRVPVLLPRGGHASVEVSLPREDAIPPGFVLVPAGESLIGSDEENIRVGLGVSPLHTVRVDSFLIGRFEVAFADYIAWLDTLPEAERRRRSPSSPSSPGAIELRRGADGRWTLSIQPTTARYVAAWGEPLRYPGRMLRAVVEFVRAPRRRSLAVQDWRRFPVTGISFEDATAYAAWLAGTLAGAHVCREEEWERAGRGADARIYTGGRQLAPSEANFDVTYGARDPAFGPDEVGSHPESASVFGVEDLQGNADELVASGRWGEANAQRGGSWYREAFQQRLDNRFRSVPTTRSVETGFRVCAPFAFK